MSDIDYTFTRGSLIEIPLSFIHQDTGFLWTDVSIRSDLREGSLNGPIVHSFSPICLYSGNSVGIVLSTSGTPTTGWNLNKYYGDIRVEKTGQFGPYYPVAYMINLQNSATK